jgi:hypothetical protein
MPPQYAIITYAGGGSTGLAMTVLLNLPQAPTSVRIARSDWGEVGWPTKS